MEPKKQRQKKKRRYTLMVISDSAEGGIRQLMLGQRVLTAAAVVVLVLLLGGAGYLVYTGTALERALEVNQTLNTEVNDLTAQKEELTVRNTELTENVTLLSNTINEKVQKEEADAQKSIPSGFPLAGAATIQESSEIEAQESVQEQEDQAEAQQENPQEGAAEEGPQEEKSAEAKTPIVVFSASTETSVIVTGNGVVEKIEADAEYGNVIRVNHGNGYVSIYRNPSPAKVKEGDEITKGTMLIEMTTENETLGYQIMKDGEYIDPLELMEIYG